ncbi:hypothetical protein LPW11_21145 [Geomonas sp. RF6]|uniref:hypothetical protein n=1 Tax=Geomonas sp. RF6 TaxID=2897342 RepID=UPI001E2CFCF3|nr:hypothetical protein [Geomonas sp. RF6]UFS70361.1 hypothetical protein LPW11_21145 [Geomonas sp. RF6]
MKSSLRRVRFLVAMIAALLLLVSPSYGEEDWRLEFDTACASTTNAMGLSVPQIKALLDKCDRVQKAIEQQDETVRKVYLKRLQMCRNLYAYVLEYKTKAQGEQ